ncbi:hypothetical protein [Paenibacillus hubeiensis]|uniref:hypothetical protein n=1 Tax=Paenibacillus hubeiensis TaxID=3077330 RepID=UPI0031BB7F12
MQHSVSSGSVGIENSVLDLKNKIDHVSAQLDILNHSLYVNNEYGSWIVISLMIIAAMMMFLVGYLLTRR